MSAAVLPHDLAAEIEELDLHQAADFLDATPVDPGYGFAAPQWLRVWERAYLQASDWRGPVRVYAKPFAGACKGFIAFADQRIKGVYVKALGGYYWPFRSVCVSAEEREGFAQSLARHFAQRAPGPVLRFGPVLDQDPGMCAVLRALSEAGWKSLRKHAGDALRQRLTTVDALHEAMPASLHKSIRKRLRRVVSERGELAYERRPLVGDCAELLDELETLSSVSWQGTEGSTAKFLGASERSFWQAMTEAGDLAAQPVLWVLRCGGRAVAFQVQIETQDVIYKIGCGYDPAWKPYSPGSLLTYAILTSICERGGALIDWGRGDSGYKQTWGAACGGTLAEVLLFHPGVAGRAALTLARRALPDWSEADNLRAS